jgi:hypothetical protein
MLPCWMRRGIPRMLSPTSSEPDICRTPSARGQWRSLDLEKLFTALQAEREFHFDLDTSRVPTVDLKSQLVACR